MVIYVVKSPNNQELKLLWVCVMGSPYTRENNNARQKKFQTLF